jgi:hypothetical protein
MNESEEAESASAQFPELSSEHGIHRLQDNVTSDGIKGKEEDDVVQKRESEVLKSPTAANSSLKLEKYIEDYGEYGKDEYGHNLYNVWSFWKEPLLTAEDFTSAITVFSRGEWPLNQAPQDQGVFDNEEVTGRETNMGNLQTSEGKKAKALLKAKKSPARDGAKLQSCSEAKKGKGGEEVGGGGGGNDPAGNRYLVTDSWRQVQRLQEEEVKTPSKESSSGDSVFTDPVVPLAQNEAVEEDEVTLTMDSQIDLGPLATLPPLDMPSPGAQVSETPSPLRETSGPKFTIVRHRKVELAPNKLSDQCLSGILSG